jgi:hypothetical protein
MAMPSVTSHNIAAGRNEATAFAYSAPSAQWKLKNAGKSSPVRSDLAAAICGPKLQAFASKPHPSPAQKSGLCATGMW